MAQTLQNQITYAKSMNGIVSLSDGAGTMISNGTIDTDNLVVDNFTVINMLVNYMNILRDSNPVVNAALGSTVDIGLLVQNMIFDDINRLYQIWDDTATYKLFEVDVSNNTVTFNNSTVTIDRKSTVALNTLLGSTLNLNTLCQNLNYNTTNRVFEIWNDTATGQLFVVDTSNNGMQIQTNTFNIVCSTTNIASPTLSFTSSAVSFANSTVTFNSFLPTSTVTPSADNELITRIYADSRYAELATSNEFTSSNSFNSFLPTSSIATAVIGTQFITRAIGDGRFGQLAAANAWTSTNTFNSNLPTSSIATTTGGTQFITRAIGDGRFGQLAAANTFTSTNSFTGGSCLVTTQPENTNNTTAVSTAYFYRMIRGDSTLRNISIGQNANPSNVSANNFALGFGALQNASATSSDCVGLGINSLNALTTGYYCFGMGGGAMQFATTSTRCVALGYATFPNGNPTNSVCIGANSGSASSGSDNYIFGVFTANSLSSGSSNFICGSSAALVLTTGNENIICGYASGGGIITGSRNTLLGTNTSASSDFSNGCAIGYNAVINANNEIALGTSTETVKVYGNLVLQNKLSLQSATLYNTASVTLSFGSSLNENIILQSNTVTDIYLPASYIDANIGCSFTVTRAYTPIITDDIQFDTAGGATFVSADFTSGPTEWFMDESITTVKLTLTKISTTYTWVLSYTRRIAILADTTSNINYPVLFGPLSANAQEVYADSTNINYNPSTDTLNVNNISTTKPILEKQDTGVSVSTTTNVDVDPTAGQYSLYKFCNMGVGIITYRLPTIIPSTVGWRFMVKRLYGSNMNVCTFNPSAFTTQPIIFDSTGAPSTASYNMSVTQSMFEFVSTITQVGGFTGTFTNAASSTTITINTILVGNIIFLGGIINLNGNIRTVVAYGTGRGQTGTYTVNTAITLANTTQSYTSTESYGYILTSFN